MHPKTLFRLLVKAVGVWVTITGVIGLPRLIGQLSLTGWATPGAYLTWIVPSVAEIAIGLYLFFGGELVVRLAIPSNRPSCPECGYDISGLVDGGCPECGAGLVELDAQLRVSTSQNPEKALE